MSPHAKRSCNRSKLVVLVATGTFAVASAATAAAAIWPSSGASASAATQPPVIKSQIAPAQLVVASQQVRAVVEGRAYELAVVAAKRAAARKKAAQEKAAVAEEKAAAEKKAQAKLASEDSGTPQQIAQAMLGQFGWSSSQFSCLDSLWTGESGWQVTAYNPNTGAYGIPQAVPGSKMRSAGPDWQTSAYIQIRWGLGYIQATYGSPCSAWQHEETDGWY
jgi:hypothetical protein